jgi:hypothetical protein
LFPGRRAAWRRPATHKSASYEALFSWEALK